MSKQPSPLPRAEMSDYEGAVKDWGHAVSRPEEPWLMAHCHARIVKEYARRNVWWRRLLRSAGLIG